MPTPSKLATKDGARLTTTGSLPCKADHDGVAALEKYLYFLGLIRDLLCILGTYDKALAAQNALITDDICLISGESN